MKPKISYLTFVAQMDIQMVVFDFSGRVFHHMPWSSGYESPMLELADEDPKPTRKEKNFMQKYITERYYSETE